MCTKVVDIEIPMPWGPISGRTFGEERTMPVLCVHGRSDNLESFSKLIPLLPWNHYYICIDLPGHGKSAHADKGYILDIWWYTLVVKRVIDHFKWPKLYILGHSLGGQIGFLLAAFYPELVLKLILIDSFLYPSMRTAKVLRNSFFDPILKLEKRSHLDEAPTYSLSVFLQKMKEGRMTESTDDQVRAMAERNLTKIGPDQYKYSNDQRTKLLGVIHVSFDYLQNIASEICCPTLIIYGKYSSVTQSQNVCGGPVHSYLEHNNNVSIHSIEGDHDVHLTHPQQVARLIVPFFSGKPISKL